MVVMFVSSMYLWLHVHDVYILFVSLCVHLSVLGKFHDTLHVCTDVALFVLLWYSIAKGSGYKIGELNDLQEGSSLLIGGKEIEVSIHMQQFYWAA